jgi:glutamate/tyrosine decarboxylase-like PLP-dependent enzyme
MDSDRKLLESAARRGIDYLDSLDNRSVGPTSEAVAQLASQLDTNLSETPTAGEEILHFLDRYGAPATVARAGGRYFGFVTGAALPASLAAHWVSAAWDQNSFSHVSSPAAALFEETALRWLAEALGLPEGTTGTITTGATMANFACLAAARYRVLERVGWDVGARGLFGAPEITVVVGDEAHSSLYKVLSFLGLGRDRVTKVPTDGQGRMVPGRFPRLEGPSIVCLQGGNVNSGSFDPAEELVPVAHEAGAWVHADAAFGLWAMASPKLRQHARGYELCDSVATDCHKWLNVPYDAGVGLLRDAEALKAAMAQSGAYLIFSERRDAIDFTPDSSRRSRGIDIWAALKSLGKQGLADMIERNCRQARRFADGLTGAGFEVLNDVVLNQVLVAFDDEVRTDAVIAALQDEGTCWCGGTVWQGRPAMRISVSSWATTDGDIDRSLQAVKSVAAS